MNFRPLHKSALKRQGYNVLGSVIIKDGETQGYIDKKGNLITSDSNLVRLLCRFNTRLGGFVVFENKDR